MRQDDVQPHRFAARFHGAAIGRFHDARAAARADKQALVFVADQAVLGDDAAKAPCFFVIVGVPQGLLGLGNGAAVTRLHGLSVQLLGFFHAFKAGAAIDHDGAVYAMLMLHQVGLEHFQLNTDATRFGAREKFAIGKSGAVGFALHFAGLVSANQAFLQVVGAFQIHILFMVFLPKNGVKTAWAAIKIKASIKA